MLPASTIYLPFSQNATMNKCKWRCWWGTTRWKKLDKIFLWWKFLREKSAGKGNWIFSKPFEPKFCAAASFQIERNIQEWTNAWMQRKERKDDWNREAAPKKNKVNYVFFLDIIHLQSAHQQLKQIINLLIKDFC